MRTITYDERATLRQLCAHSEAGADSLVIKLLASLAEVEAQRDALAYKIREFDCPTGKLVCYDYLTAGCVGCWCDWASKNKGYGEE